MSLTEEELFTYLNRAGKAVTRRRVMSWREKGLLPDFDVRGRGRGRGQGRASSYWDDAEKIISQASTIFELLQWRDRVEDAYLPLWLLGYQIPVEIARRKLREEIVNLRELLAKEEEVRYEDREDVLYALACALFDKWQTERDSEVPALESIDLIVQIVGNPHYAPDDPISTNLEFVREYLSLTALDEALADVTSEELSQLQRDVGVISNVARLVFSVLPRFPADSSHKYGLLTFAGRLIVMFDLAFRRAGYGADIDYYLSIAAGSAFRDNLHKLKETYAERHPMKEV